MSRRILPSAASRRWAALAARWPWLAAQTAGHPLAGPLDRVCLDCSVATLRGARDAREAWGVVSRDPLALTPEGVSWFARWQSCRQVYRVDPEVARELSVQGLDGELPVMALSMLPYPIVYIDSPVALGEDVARGFVAWVAPSGHERDELYLAFLSSGGDEWRTSLPLVAGTTLSGAAATMSAEAEAAAMAVGVSSPEPGAEGLAERLAPALNLLLYVNSREGDAEVVWSPPSGGRGQRPGPRTNPETVRALGARMGRAIGAARRSSAVTGAGCGGTVSPHIRRAHWQHYWVGPRKGRDDGRHGDGLVLRWVPPVYVLGGGSAAEVVHEG